MAHFPRSLRCGDRVWLQSYFYRDGADGSMRAHDRCCRTSRLREPLGLGGLSDLGSVGLTGLARVGLGLDAHATNRRDATHSQAASGGGRMRRSASVLRFCTMAAAPSWRRPRCCRSISHRNHGSRAFSSPVSTASTRLGHPRFRDIAVRTAPLHLTGRVSCFDGRVHEVRGRHCDGAG